MPAKKKPAAVKPVFNPTVERYIRRVYREEKKSAEEVNVILSKTLPRYANGKEMDLLKKVKVKYPGTDEKTRTNDSLNNYRCRSCQHHLFPRYGNFSGIKAYDESDGCHILVKCQDVGHYGEIYITTDGPPKPMGQRVKHEHGSRYFFERCLCTCHTKACGNVNWMRKEKWYKISNYDAED